MRNPPSAPVLPSSFDIAIPLKSLPASAGRDFLQKRGAGLLRAGSSFLGASAFLLQTGRDTMREMKISRREIL